MNVVDGVVVVLAPLLVYIAKVIDHSNHETKQVSEDLKRIEQEPSMTQIKVKPLPHPFREPQQPAPVRGTVGGSAGAISNYYFALMHSLDSELLKFYGPNAHVVEAEFKIHTDTDGNYNVHYKRNAP